MEEVMTQKVKMSWFAFPLFEKEKAKNHYTESNDDLGYGLPCNRRKMEEITV